MGPRSANFPAPRWPLDRSPGCHQPALEPRFGSQQCHSRLPAAAFSATTAGLVEFLAFIVNTHPSSGWDIASESRASFSEMDEVRLPLLRSRMRCNGQFRRGSYDLASTRSKTPTLAGI